MSRQPKSGSRPKRSKSGRQQPAQKTHERVRNIALKIDRPNVNVVLGLPSEGTPLTFFDSITGEQLDFGADAVEVGLMYMRPNGKPKVITRFPQHPSKTGVDLNEKLLEYDHVFAVDTNTDPTSGVSAIAMMQLDNLRRVPEGINFLPRFPDTTCVARPEPGMNPEKFGWIYAIGWIGRAGHTGKVALVVDSCLSDLPAINDRTQEMLAGFMLPSNFTLIYATGDTGTDQLCGPLAISMCDRLARRVLPSAPRLEVGQVGWVRLTQEILNEVVSGAPASVLGAIGGEADA